MTPITPGIRVAVIVSVFLMLLLLVIASVKTGAITMGSKQVIVKREDFDSMKAGTGNKACPTCLVVVSPGTVKRVKDAVSQAKELVK